MEICTLTTLSGRERGQVSIVVDQVMLLLAKGREERLMSKGGGDKAGQGN